MLFLNRIHPIFQLAFLGLISSSFVFRLMPILEEALDGSIVCSVLRRMVVVVGQSESAVFTP